MKVNLRKNVGNPLYSIPFIVFIDQLAKLLALRYLATACNSGIAFGLFPGFANYAFAICILAFVGWQLISSNSVTFSGSSLKKLGLVWIFAGGVSNLIDRIVRGCVVDFIDSKFWPAFNLADAAVCLGVVILIVGLVKKEKTDVENS